MSRKLTYSAAGFARRVMMSTTSIFALVEGKVLDAAFYDRLLAAHNGFATVGYEIRLIQQVALPNTQAGGKRALYALHDFYRQRGLLKQATIAGERHIIFFADRDYDHIAGRLKRSKNILYTTYADVEAELFASGDLQQAISSTLSLTMAEASDAMAHLNSPLSELAHLWKDWIELCCLSMCLRSRCEVRPSLPSQIHKQFFGPLDSAELLRCEHLVRSKSQSANTQWREQRIRACVRNIYSRGEGRTLVKGKWLPAYLEHRLRAHFGSSPVHFGGFKDGITRAMLDSIDFSAAWRTAWDDRLDAAVGPI